jgi:hypothetical protein
VLAVGDGALKLIESAQPRWCAAQRTPSGRAGAGFERGQLVGREATAA